MRVKAAGRQHLPVADGSSATAGTLRAQRRSGPLNSRSAVARPGFGRPGTFRPGALVSSPRPSTYCSYAKHNQDGKGSVPTAQFGPVGHWQRVNPMIVAHALINSVAFIGYTLLAGQVSWLP